MTVGVQQHFPTGKFTQSRSMDDDRTGCTCSQLEVRILGIMRAVAQDMLDKGVENFTLVLDVQDVFGIKQSRTRSRCAAQRTGTLCCSRRTVLAS